MEDIFLFLVTVTVFGGLGMLAYRYRYQIRKWLKDSKYGTEWSPSRETILRRRIEDNEEEIEFIRSKGKET